jgi:hypothetical protein
MHESRATTSPDDRAAWHKGPVGGWLLRRRLMDGGMLIGRIDETPEGFVWSAGAPNHYGRIGKSRSRYAAQRAVRKALREMS